ncbi:SANT domain-containing transcription factor TFIIIB [Cryptosporidium canis]|uniref:SANT domain-containing transcription factor TFIIIB n=1 Tax=Cryptosporidium canis TaxID=195482 RepID=A0A9D5DFZ5_9CRYT|nr:SANT domain-containing transcription factor TFIIIB [Cryptosporidium canis]
MVGNDSERGDSATLWSIVIKTAYRKRRSRRRQNERSRSSLDGSVGVDGGQNTGSIFSDGKDAALNGVENWLPNNRAGLPDSRNNGDDLLKFLLDGSSRPESRGPEVSSSDLDKTDGEGRTAGSSSSGFFSELFSVDKLNGGGNSKLSIDCKGDIVLEDNSSSGGSGRQLDWLGLMEGRVYINENMAGTSLQPYSGAYKRTKSKRWSMEQTNKFYDALSLFGTDLMLVKSVFPEFTDKQIHDKFKAEEKKNKQKLDDILINKKKKLTKEDVLIFKQKYK